MNSINRKIPAILFDTKIHPLYIQNYLHSMSYYKSLKNIFLEVSDIPVYPYTVVNIVLQAVLNQNRRQWESEIKDKTFENITYNQTEPAPKNKDRTKVEAIQKRHHCDLRTAEQIYKIQKAYEKAGLDTTYKCKPKRYQK